MSDVREIATLMRSLEDQLVVCMRCGMCQAVCPLFAETGRESDVARGKLALLDGLLQEMFKDAEGVYQRLNKCLLCGSCAANCPSGVNVLEIFIKARAILTGFMGLPPAKRILLRGMLAHPEIFDRLAEWGALFQKIFTKPVNAVVGTSCARIASPLLGGRHFRPLADKPFHRMLPFLNTRSKGSLPRTAYFVGCLIDKVFPNVAQAAVDVLTHHGVGVFMPQGQACCGIPAISSGDTETFDRLIRQNLSLLTLEPFDFLVTACATCTSTIREIWPKMARPDIKRQVEAIASKTMDISQFLVMHAKIDNVEPGAGEIRRKITYHDPCHLKKSLKVSAEPRRLLRANGHYELVEMPESDWCCGMGGSFNLQYYDISAEIGNRTRDNIVASGCSVIATGCPACMMQISDMLSKAGDRIMVKHPVEVYAESLDRKEAQA
jgi:glycolate oxidase iron-sulfur subunit